MSAARHSRSRSCRQAFTLAELAVTILVMSVIVSALASSLVLATRAIPTGNDPLAQSLSAAESLDQIGQDLYGAISFSERSATGVTFTVADRDNDANPETIRYAWSGIAGGALTRQVNAGAAAVLLGSVESFALGYDYRTRSDPPPAQANESAETLLASYDPAINQADFKLTATLNAGQYFLPALAANVTSWKVTRITIVARRLNQPNGITAVQLHLPTAGNLPGAGVLEEVLMDESTLWWVYWFEDFSFTQVADLSPRQGLCLTLTKAGGSGNLADVAYDDVAGAGMLTSSDGGLSWSFDARRSLRFFVYGTVTTMTRPAAVQRWWLRAVAATLQVSADSATRVQSSIQILNQPEVPGP